MNTTTACVPRRRARAWMIAALLLGCTSAPAGDPPATPVNVPPTPAVQQARNALRAAIGEGVMSPEDFAARYPVSLTTTLPYDPRAAAGLSTVQGSPVALNEGELNSLGRSGFVITERRRFPTFTYGYATLYMADLPLYVSADSILHAVHSAFDDMLAAIEVASLRGDLDAMLDAMLARLASPAGAALDPQARADADVYVAVALSLLRGSNIEPGAGGDVSEARALAGMATAAAGRRTVGFFGTSRDEDFSQYRPRGHYNDSPELQRYFRAMMWLGRMDLRVVETLPDGSQRLNRRQLRGAYALRAAMNDAALGAWRRIDQTIAGFVGESDNMTLAQLDPLLRDLGVADVSGLAGLSDEAIVRAVLAGGYGAQRISSHIMINGTRTGFTLPLSSTFLLLGQRYVLDSHVFSNVVYDRAGGGSVRRMMPDPLDAAFAALGNDQAGALLGEGLRRYAYARDLHAMRVLADAHGDAYWDANLYNRWMGALRTLSPRAALADTASAGLPAVARTEAWGRRVLNTQLASWAELRHDTILYVKQSYTSGAVCEFPDAYVEPYPAFFAALEGYARRGEALVEALDLSASPALATRVREYFPRLRDVAGRLREMAERQRAGMAFTEAQMAFINQAVRVQQICGGATSEGWFPRLYFTPSSATQFDPTIADVHTQPTDEGGADVGRVLHVATGSPRLMVVTVNTCNGPRAYAGLASSYFERTTERYDRLDDIRWAREIETANPVDPAWLQPVITR
jgi:hypothetical protein